jgi:hypothetical protein
VLLNIWLVIIGLMVIAGIGFRLIPHRLPFVQLHKVAPKAASLLVGEFIESSYDGDFGYPSGRFQVETSTEHEVLAREIVARGSHFTQILKGLYKAVLGIGSAFGCFGSLVALVIAVFLTPALIYAALAETLLKYLLRSKIVSTLEDAGDGTRVAFELRGPVALLVGRRLERAFHAPVLPARVATLAGIPLVTAITAPAGNPVPAGAPVPAGILAPGTEPVSPGPLPADPVPADATPADGHPPDGPAPTDDDADPSPA